MPAHAAERDQEERQISQRPGLGIFVHLPEYPFVICETCKFGCVAKEADSHLREQHNIPAPARRVIIQAIQAIPGIIQDQAGLRDFQFPAPTTKPVPFIAPARDDGIGCDRCPFVIRTVQGIQKHYRESHGWANDWKKGGDVAKRAGKVRQVPWRTGVRYQRFFVRRAASRWFEVGRLVTGEQGEQRIAEEDRSEDAIKFFDRIYREDEEAFESEAKARVQDASDK
ncbi:hypothetical protein BHE90_017602 [Fusarium euwallaceae]|uniref:C2H2-type domain-containing protein n=1 Tax=Fusarium euwallaceae TaxID=1147111 RepID=A0A430KWZ7_9HYPO|nr:hypothetical protein BHE90_017602 [Fusarium euwallaceae]